MMIASNALDVDIMNVLCVGVRDMMNVMTAMEMDGCVVESVMAKAWYMYYVVTVTARD